MVNKITLANIGSFQNDTPAATAFNANNSLITTAVNNTLSRDGTSPNQMISNLDMNSNQILNLPSPATTSSPARLIDVVSNPTITVPPVGTSGATVPLLNANNTWSGTNTFNAAVSIPFTQTGTGAVLRTVDSKIKDYSVSVADFGAVGDGTTDDTTAIQNAINSLPAVGGTVVFMSGKTYKVTSPINIGNGTSSLQSTKQGIYLVGQSSPGGFDSLSTNIIWGGGSSASALILVNGPISPWGLVNLTLSGNSLMANGVNIVDGCQGEITNCVFTSFTSRSIQCTSTPLGGTGHHGTQFNYFRNLVIYVSNVAQAMGILLDGDNTDSNSNTSFNTFENINIFLPNAATTLYGIYLKGTDSNVFSCMSVFGGGASSAGVTFDYSATGASGIFPSDNRFFTFDSSINLFGGIDWNNLGTPGVGARPNVVDWVAVNGGIFPSLPNLTFKVPDTRCFLNLTGQTAQYNQTLYTPVYRGLLRLNYYLVTTTVGSAGTYAGRVFWFDASGLQQNVITASVSATALGAYTSGSLIIDASTGGVVTQQVNFSGVTGALQYALVVTLERLN